MFTKFETNFLDVTAILNNNQFAPELYLKPTGYHQYFHYNSCHPEHTKNSSVYLQALCIKRLCYEETFLTNDLKDLRS